MIFASRTCSQRYGGGVLVYQDNTWAAWVGGVRSGTGLVWVTRRGCEGDDVLWRGYLVEGRLRRWYLDRAGAGGWFPQNPWPRGPIRMLWPVGLRVCEKVYRKHKRPDWSELTQIARAARRNLNGVAILDWLRETGSASAPCLAGVLDFAPFGPETVVTRQ